MQNYMIGRDELNNNIWTARQCGNLHATTEMWEEMWESTGIKESGIVVHIDFRAALQWNLTQYPETDSLHAQLNDNYKMAMPRNAAAITILDAIARELGHVE